MPKQVSDNSFDTDVLNAEGPYWSIFGQNGAAHVNKLPRPWMNWTPKWAIRSPSPRSTSTTTHDTVQIRRARHSDANPVQGRSEVAATKVGAIPPSALKAGF